MLLEVGIRSHAIFSADRIYRHALYRTWDDGKPKMLFFGLNPSTADETVNDPTVSRIMYRAGSLGYGGLLVGNIFDYRATDPKVMKAAAEPNSVHNNHYLLEMAQQAVDSGGIILCGWGKDGKHQSRGARVADMLGKYDLYCLKVNGDKMPSHPLYLGYSLKPVLWRKAL